jgi:hypothetical protein
MMRRDVAAVFRNVSATRAPALTRAHACEHAHVQDHTTALEQATKTAYTSVPALQEALGYVSAWEAGPNRRAAGARAVSRTCCEGKREKRVPQAVTFARGDICVCAPARVGVSTVRVLAACVCRACGRAGGTKRGLWRQ